MIKIQQSTCTIIPVVFVLCMAISACVPMGRQYGDSKNTGLPLSAQAWLINQQYHLFNLRQNHEEADENFIPKNIEVMLVSGSAQMKQSRTNEKFISESIQLKLNSCGLVSLLNAQKQDRSWLKLCYFSGVLYLDGSDWKAGSQENAIHIHASTVWSTGYSYSNLFSLGNTHLLNTMLHVREIDPLPL